MSVVLLAFGAALFFGLALVLTQAGLRHLGPLQGASISVSSATFLFAVLSPVTIGFRVWVGESAMIFALIGCLFPATVTMLTFYGNRRFGPNLTGALGNLAPLFAVLIAVVALGETPGTGKIAGVLIIVFGVVLLYRVPRIGRGEGFEWAFALPLAAAFIRGLVQPMVKIGLEAWPNPFVPVTIGYLISTLVVLASSAIRERGWPLPFNRAGWLWFSAVGVCNGLAVLAMYQALALAPVTLVAPLVACYPIATLAFNRAFHGPAGLPAQTVVGVGFTVAGIAFLLMT